MASTPSEPLLDQTEDRVLSHLAMAWNAFTFLETLTPSELDDFTRAVRTAQNIVMARPVVRQLNTEPNTKK
jgi:hypothetical protein